MRRQSIVAAVLGVAAAGCSGAQPSGEAVGTSSEAITFANDQPAFDYFLGKGLTPFQAAGIVGNLDQESGVDPTSVQSGGPGRGIAQWSVGGRWDTDSNDNATWYAGTQNKSVLSLQLQLDFIWYELTTFSGYGLSELKQATNVSDATVVFETKFEGCGTCDQSQRVSYAENVLAAFGADSPDAAGVPDAASADSGGEGPCTVTTTGESGECLDTAACAALGNHVSTPGFCPGPDNIQCCTSVPGQVDMDAGSPPPPDMDAAAPPPPPSSDAGTAPADAAPPVATLDAAVPVAPRDAGPDADVAGADGGTILAVSSAGGCATSPAGAPGLAGWLPGFAFMVARRRRRLASRR